ncbi:MAG TPA: thiol peroxidase [Isosphaeraceae bacterium]|jgi:thiol peroxidase
MADVRKGEVTMKGNPVDLAGPKLKPGDKAPDFAVVNDGLGTVTLKDTAGKVRLFSVVPSLDTPVCSLQTQRFAKELNALGDKVAAYTISLDLPFAMKRFCADHDIKNLGNLSDAHDQSFGKNYGVLITSLPIPLLARAIFVIDPSDTIRHIEIVPEIATEPDYDATLSAVKAAAGV